MAVDETKKVEETGMSNEQTHILLEAIKIIAEKSEDKEEFLKLMERLQNAKKPQ